MARYYKKELVEAVQWFKHGDHTKVTKMWISNGPINSTCCSMATKFGWINNQVVTLGDYIIKYDNGEYDVQPQEKFESEYVKADSIKVRFQKATPMKPRKIDIC